MINSSRKCTPPPVVTMVEGAGEPSCRICQADTVAAGCKRSSWSGRDFALRRCPSCQFAFVANPRLDYDALYDDDYYHGRGADPLLDYVEEVEHSETTVRKYEWQGICQLVSSFVPTGPATRWLDYGCGLGGLVEFVRRRGMADAVGFDQGWSMRQLQERGVPHLSVDEIESTSGSFDVVTAIEVIEHTVDPVGELARMRTLLRPGGLLFLTTGNAAPYRDRLAAWRYVMPDIHVSFFEPPTLALALDKAGFDAEFPGYQPGWDDIIRFKVLKSLGVRRDTWPSRTVPWGVASRVVDRRLKPSAHPIGWARTPTA
jgi:SAM-dependent methyltransferase